MAFTTYLCKNTLTQFATRS